MIAYNWYLGIYSQISIHPLSYLLCTKQCHTCWSLTHTERQFTVSNLRKYACFGLWEAAGVPGEIPHRHREIMQTPKKGANQVLNRQLCWGHSAVHRVRKLGHDIRSACHLGALCKTSKRLIWSMGLLFFPLLRAAFISEWQQKTLCEMHQVFVKEVWAATSARFLLSLCNPGW